MNKNEYLGRITKDPELTESENGKTYLRFTIAVDRNFKNKDGKRDTDFIPCVAFGSTAEYIAKHIGKGGRIMVEGDLRTKSWTDKDGIERYGFDVFVGNAEVIDYKLDKEKTKDAEQEEEHKTDDDIDP